LTDGRTGRVGTPHAQAEYGERVIGQTRVRSRPSSGWLRIAPMYTVPKPEGFGGHHRILGGQRCIDGGNQEHLEIVVGARRHAGEHADPIQTRQIGDPDQQQRTFAHMGLPAHQRRQAGLALGVLHGNHAPGLQIRRRGGRLGRCHHQRQRALGAQDRAERPARNDGRAGIRSPDWRLRPCRAGVMPSA
jgi:hypothetical protein